MRQLGKRLVSSAFLISFTLATIFYAPVWLFFCVMELLIFLSLKEYLSLVSRGGVVIHRTLALVLGLLLPLAVLYSCQFVMIAAATGIIFVAYFNPKTTQHGLTGTALTVLGLVYIPWFFSHTTMLRGLPDGSWWVFYVVLLVKAGDAGAYFSGKLLGKNKLIEHISPNKSVEGAIGGFITSVVLSVVAKSFLPNVSLLHLVIMGASIAVIGQVSDLIESMIKRNAGAKDSGEMPGLGGFLDVLDSLLLTVPFVYYYAVNILHIGA
ncbi:MAG: phosphatidate cytidylyltransferase [Candidatus Omnitrophica bacterium]|nr:phosphatidate cytidylyltransferase [Candidatus Omnitrophota bacterium]